ncbi:glycosyltransferase family 2 protein [Zunongwangia sp. HGR-M22]|uniref:glycosyltransferase family 2 protein n=1 Tax=Zunongwangia sp. HGR-M22 TaxID=3015168 RepID=UPI0022DDF063|nr:glycosyltransferase [Zunongwangia sp. HGR-M22]WBL25280.1 glycosyltransferase [Zunongwangia sp. HGR-M22]
MLIFVILIAILYAALMLAFLKGWNSLKPSTDNYEPPKTRFSIIIPFRNEAENLPDLLESLAILNYPFKLFEILLINDESEDDSEKIIAEFIETQPQLNLKVLQNHRISNSPKKDAIKTAIEMAQLEYILTTDADCKIPQNWLQSFNTEILENNSVMIAAPVKIEITDKKFVTSFEALDFLSLQITGAGAFGIKKAFMANGANLCYKKESFVKQNGFEGNSEIASGDDVFLLQKFIQQQLKVTFLKDQNAIVKTKPQSSFKRLVQQRIRWASKTSAYTSNFAKLTGLIVFNMNIAFSLSLLFGIFKLFPFPYFMILFLVKFNLDFVLLYRGTILFKNESLMRKYLISSVLYPFFSVYVAILSLFGGYNWKGRRFKR